MIVRVLATLAALAGIAFAAVALQLSARPLPEVTGGRTEPAVPATMAVRPARPNPPDLSQFAALEQRPPFSPDRRPPRDMPPPPPPIPKSEPSVVERLEARLIGIMTDGDERFAILAPTRGSATEFLRRGQEIEGWTVEEIEERRVILRKGAEREEVLLFQ
ncbi:hypothetical protein [Futiania mangrovi]|uniref:Type II secretion system protein GspC N-terminal domain-containing protein n=1 Tax=Futiania mangrovi TaxID=2959716 RepID=A0A9J6PP54_9PROT|nr:hypothetical protein [Futiania mangrovii]MCP1337874.1 hypothetical protein [Futiania mangrovii]